MKLLYELQESQIEALALLEGESIWYCVPVDLGFDNKQKLAREEYAKTNWIVVTEERLLALRENQVMTSFLLKDCSQIKCEHQVNCGILTVTTKDTETICVARFSMRHMVRMSYVAQGAQAIAGALREGRIAKETERIDSRESEKYCDRCGRALPGTSKCPRCDGNGSVLKRLFELCKKYKKEMMLTSIFMLVVAGIDIVVPRVQRWFIDGSLASGKATWTSWSQFAVLTLALVGAYIIAEILRHWYCVILGTGISMTLREKLYYKIQALSLSFMNKRKPGELLNRVSNDTVMIRRFIEETLGYILTSIITMIIAIVMMFVIDWKMTLIILGIHAVVFVSTTIFRRRNRANFRKQWVKADELSSNLQDVISGMRIVKSFGKEQKEIDKFTRIANEYAALSRKNESFWVSIIPILWFLMGSGVYVAVYFGGIDVLNGDMSPGTLLQYYTYCGYLLEPLSSMVNLPRTLAQTMNSLNRIYDVLDEEPKIIDSEKSMDVQIHGDFTFENISFGYELYEPVLEDVSFEVKAGEMIGLVGASGVGKSTLINLIMRLYDVNQGKILIDGVDIRNIKTDSLHSQIGVVLQETFLFSGTILDNIRFAKQNATIAEVLQAAKAANAHDFICKMPDGYNTYVGEQGANLSGGERQRIAIARAILNDPRILILDEATSALDTENEFVIQMALERLIKGRTTFAIAHRLSTLRNADRLVVIDQHGIAEIGTHNELLEKKGIYYGLVTAQLAMAEGK